jgi:thymidine phosphorylase
MIVLEIKSSKSGYVSRCDARIIGEVVRDLGGGRLTKGAAINYDVGIDRLIKPGENVRRGDVLARIHAADHREAETALGKARSAFTIQRARPRRSKLIVATVTN